MDQNRISSENSHRQTADFSNFNCFKLKMATTIPSRTSCMIFVVQHHHQDHQLVINSTVALNSSTAFNKNSNQKNDNIYKYYQRAFNRWLENFESKSNSQSKSNSKSNSSNTNVWFQKISSCDKLYESYCSNNIECFKDGLFLSVSAALEKLLEVYNGNNINKENGNCNENTTFPCNYNCVFKDQSS